MAALCLVGLSACGSSEVAPSDRIETVVSFASDIAPLFARGCAVGGAACHGDAKVLREGRPYLGDVDASATRARLVSVPSQEAPAMLQVAPGDPTASFLMRKMDGDQAKLSIQCASGPLAATFPNCGEAMPQGYGMLLPEADRAMVRQWISQGAADN